MVFGSHFLAPHVSCSEMPRGMTRNEHRPRRISGVAEGSHCTKLSVSDMRNHGSAARALFPKTKRSFELDVFRETQDGAILRFVRPRGHSRVKYSGVAHRPQLYLRTHLRITGLLCIGRICICAPMGARICVLVHAPHRSCAPATLAFACDPAP